jgi:hypothetical protein
MLSFRYRMFANDIIHFSDFNAWISRSNGAWLADVVRDGFRSCQDPPQAPPAGHDLGWRKASYDLSAFKGEMVRIVFENRNLHSGYSYGIWTHVDDVRVVDAGPQPPSPGPHRSYLSLVRADRGCDPVPSGTVAEMLLRPDWPGDKQGE